MLWLKLGGLGLIFVGFWLIKYFPEELEIQKAGFLRSGLFTGFVFILLGIILLVVG